MNRVPEPELMTGEEQAQAYARADFSEPHDMFIEALSQRLPASQNNHMVLDLGCGPADISIRYAKHFPDSQLHAVDGSKAMLKHAVNAIMEENLDSRITLYEQVLPELDLPRPSYDVILSNSLLHHLRKPEDLWKCIISLSDIHTFIFIMDLMRPESITSAEKLVRLYARNEPEILQQDFYNSLLAAYTPREVNQQLHKYGLGYMTIEILTDRHLCVFGQIKQH